MRLLDLFSGVGGGMTVRILIGVERGTLTKKNDDARLIFTWTHEADA
jgi:hypothetical protein